MLNWFSNLRLVQFLDRVTDNYISNHTTVLNINSTPTRWGMLSVFSTISLGSIAIGLGFLAVLPDAHGGVYTLVIGLACIFGFGGLFIGLFVTWFALYSLRKPYVPTDTERQVAEIHEAIVGKKRPDISAINSAIRQDLRGIRDGKESEMAISTSTPNHHLSEKD